MNQQVILNFLKDGTNLVEYLSNLDKDILKKFLLSLIGEVEAKLVVLEKKIQICMNFLMKKLMGINYPIKLQKSFRWDSAFVAIMSALIGNNYSIGIMIERARKTSSYESFIYILNSMRDCESQIFFYNS